MPMSFTSFRRPNRVKTVRHRTAISTTVLAMNALQIAFVRPDFAERVGAHRTAKTSDDLERHVRSPPTRTGAYQ